MATKTIPQLTENLTPAAASVVPIDDGTQTFKVPIRKLLRFDVAEVIVGSTSGCTHATLAAALADAAVVDGMRVLLTENFNLAAKLTISKRLHIRALPGVTATKTGGTIGFELDDTGITIEGVRFADYTTAGDKAISCTANATFCRVLYCNFAPSTDTDIDDATAPAGKKPIAVGNILEVA